MGISIKNARAEKLARQVAAEAGESLTDAVIHSLEERLERLKGRRSAPDLAATLMTISRRCAALPDLDQLHGKPERFAISVNGPWRITFEWEEGDAFRVDLERYH